jgi:hypothetical protein
MIQRAPHRSFISSLRSWGTTSFSRSLKFVTTAGKKFRRREVRGLQRTGARHVDAGVHFGEQRKQAHGIDVEDRLRPAADAGAGIVAGKHEEIVQTLARQMPRLGLEGVAVKILAREVDDHLAAG